MIPRYRALVERIRLELEELEHTLDVVQQHWQKALEDTVDQDAYVNSVALNLHSLYSGLERVFELIALELDGGTLGGPNWHTELLRQMTLDLGETRPPVLQKETAARLDEYRKFRHLVRSIYATNLDLKRMESLVAQLPSLWSQVRQDLGAFSVFLEELSRADDH